MISLGCAKNLVDGETMLGHLERAGIALTANAARADVVLVNTCGFIDDAKRESIDSILEVAEAKQRGHVRRLVVTGCMAQAYAEDLRREIPEIDAFVGLDELERITEAVRGELADHIPDQRGALRVYDHRDKAFVQRCQGFVGVCDPAHVDLLDLDLPFEDGVGEGYKTTHHQRLG